jgi:hypothetical protein
MYVKRDLPDRFAHYRKEMRKVDLNLTMFAKPRSGELRMPKIPTKKMEHLRSYLPDHKCFSFDADEVDLLRKGQKENKIRGGETEGLTRLHDWIW